MENFKILIYKASESSEREKKFIVAELNAISDLTDIMKKSDEPLILEFPDEDEKERFPVEFDLIAKIYDDYVE